MGTRALFSFVGALMAAVVLVSASGAAATKAQTGARIDVSTRSAVIHYLRLIHVNPKGVVIQRGGFNYAGAHCPGKRWTCTRTSHPVVQVAGAGGRNTFRCTTSRCAVVQIATAPAAATNTSKCIKVVGLTQTCTIVQSSSSGNNVAVVYQVAAGALVTTQTAALKASITQTATGSSNGNTACVSQNAVLDGSTASTRSVTVKLEAHQSILIKQDSLHGGNSAQSSATVLGTCDTGHPLTQRQLLNSLVAGRGSITQNEDDAFSACGDGVTGDYANLCLDIEQNQGAANGVASGTNNATFTQASTQTAVANTPAGPVSQTQSTQVCGDPEAPTDCVFPGGLVGTVNQDSTGVSTANATQIEKQCEDAARSGLIVCHTAPGDADFNGAYQLTQKQYGPVGVGRVRHSHRGRQLFQHGKGLGQSTQTGNSADQFTIGQTSTQDDDQGTGSTQQNTGQADCHTSGNCTVTQNTNVDGQTTTNAQSGQDVSTSTNCTGSVCTTQEPEIIFDGSPGSGAPPTTLGGYGMMPFGTDTQPLGDVSGVSDPAATILFSPDLHHDTVPSGGWNNWSNGYTGDVYDTCFQGESGCTATDPSHVRITLPAGTDAFYFYSEPNSYATFTIQATAQDGTSSGPVQVTTPNGADYFGFYGIGGATLSYIDVTADDPLGLAVGEFGISPAAPQQLQ